MPLVASLTLTGERCKRTTFPIFQRYWNVDETEAFHSIKTFDLEYFGDIVLGGETNANGENLDKLYGYVRYIENGGAVDRWTKLFAPMY